MTKDQLLAIDFGTQSVRALIFSLDGTLVAKSQIPVTGYRSEKPGWVEMDAERYWDYLGEACQNLWQQPSADRQKIAGVALTSQRNNVVNVDKQGKPLRPVIHWSDQRRTFGVKPVGGLWGAAFKLVNMDETVRTFQAEAESNWIQRFQPEIWAATHKFMYLTGYLTYRMTGKMVDSVGCQVGFVPFDYKRHHWANRLDWKWQAVNIEPEKLPGLVKPTETLGVITHEASEATGIPEGLPLIAAAGDKACEALGAGCIEPDDGCLSFGTTSNIITMHDRYIEPIPMIPPYPAAIPGHYSLEIQIFRGYWMVNWFKREFGMNEERIAKERGVPTESLFDELVKSVPPGSLGLMLQPYWTPGVKMPGPEAKGSIIGFGDIHTRAHLYRAILEGISYALREGSEQTSKRSKVPLKNLRIAGGGSQSLAAVQLTADIFGLPAQTPHVHETSGLGAAIDAAVGLGLHKDFKTAVKAMTHIGGRFEPIAENHRLYDELYNRVYKKMYPRLQPLYDEIREITGYPPKV